MSNWVEPEWLPSIPTNDSGPFYCYLLWVSDIRGYYVGHTGDPETRIKGHFSGNVKTTAGHLIELLWISYPMETRTEARHFEAALKSYVKSGDEYNFLRCTDLDYLVKRARLLD